MFMSQIEQRETERPLRELLRHFTYKPGWQFDVRDGTLLIRFEAVDTDDFTRTVPVHSPSRIPPYVHMRVFDWQRWLLDRIMDAERHEALEFFKVRGVKVYDPHKHD